MHIEKENAIHELWENKEVLGVKTKAELAKKLGVHPGYVNRHIDAWEFRHREQVDERVSTDAIRVTSGLEKEERKQILGNVAEGELGVRETYTAVKVLRKASKPLMHACMQIEKAKPPRITIFSAYSP